MRQFGARGPNFDWDAVSAAKAKELAGLGHSAAQIAKALKRPGVNGPSRNAVIGKLHRLGVTKPTLAPGRHPDAHAGSRYGFARSAPNNPPVHRAKARAPRAPMPEVADQAAVESNVLFFDRDMRHQCPWPVEPTAAAAHKNMLVCGGRRADGSAYCARHSALAFLDQKTSARELARALRRFV